MPKPIPKLAAEYPLTELILVEGRLIPCNIACTTYAVYAQSVRLRIRDKGMTTQEAFDNVRQNTAYAKKRRRDAARRIEEYMR